MAFGIQYGGDRRPIVKFDSRAGRWFRVDGKDQSTDITNGFSAVFDLAGVDIGWARFTPGQAPDFVFARIPAPIPPQPTSDHRRSMKMQIKLAKSLGGDVREWITQAACVTKAVDMLHDAYLASPEAAAGKLPVVAMTGTEAIAVNTSKNYAPVFQIVNWIARPDDMPPTAAPPAAAPRTTPTPPATGSTVVPPPARAPTPAAVATEF